RLADRVDFATPAPTTWTRDPQGEARVRRGDPHRKVSGDHPRTYCFRRGAALWRMDALMRSMLFSTEDVVILAKRYQGARGIRQLRALLPFVDGGAASPQESLLRFAFP